MASSLTSFLDDSILIEASCQLLVAAAGAPVDKQHDGRHLFLDPYDLGVAVVYQPHRQQRLDRIEIQCSLAVSD